MNAFNYPHCNAPPLGVENLEIDERDNSTLKSCNEYD